MSLHADTEYGMALLGKLGVLQRCEPAQLGSLAELLLEWDERSDGGPALAPLVALAREQLSGWITSQVDYAAVRERLAADFVPYRADVPTGQHQLRAKTLLCTGEPLPDSATPAYRRALIIDTLARWLWGERRKLSEQARLAGDRQSAYTLYRFTNHDAWRVAETAVDLETQSRRRQ